MKRIVIVTLMLLSGGFVLGQNYTPFPTEFSTWSEYNAVSAPPGGWVASMSYYSIDGDTVLNGTDYQKVFKQGLKQDETLTNPVYVGALREDSLKNIWYRNHTDPFPDTTEWLLFSFDLEIGDTVFYTDFEMQEETFAVVFATGQMLIGEEMRNTYDLQFEFGYDVWVEGMGGLRGLFSLYRPFFEQIWELSCFQTNYEQLYSFLTHNLYYQNGLDPCFTSLVVGLDEVVKVESSIVSVSPNPATTSTTFEYELAGPTTVLIQIINSQGQLIDNIELEQSQGTHSFQWSTSRLPAGMYYYRIQAGDKVGGGKMVKMR